MYKFILVSNRIKSTVVLDYKIFKKSAEDSRMS